MELKPYQKQVVEDIALFLQALQKVRTPKEAFYNFWTAHPRTPLSPFPGSAVEPYKNNVPNVPHICVKVPTAGGKTFIACNALKKIFDAFSPQKTKAVVWLVPSITILEQTIKSLKDPHHHYRQKINVHFGSRVEVFSKSDLLQGVGFNASSVLEQLNIFVLSFDSIRTANKEGRKVYEENSALQSFEVLLEEEQTVSLMNVIQHLNPVVVVDESHNAETDLSVDMLKSFHPCFILDLTATPRKNSNIISFIDALELKRENMVKLPVIVYNYPNKTDLVNAALHLQKRLELDAIAEERKGGKYIRPIVLFQAQPKNSKEFSNTEEERLNVQNIKAKLIAAKIPDEHIKIKTANINEIKGMDLGSRDCEVRYIITINALKEGWDCPFAYILATVADKSSAVDVEQILGRILRQPYVSQHNILMLNLSYVLTASSKFLDTLQNIVKGLNRAGFSQKDYRLANSNDAQTTPQAEVQQALLPLPDAPCAPATEKGEDISSDIDESKINIYTENAPPDASLADIEQQAIEISKAFEKIDAESGNPVPTELQSMMKSYKIKSAFWEQAQQIKLPQFHIKTGTSDLFLNEDILLEKGYLLKDFKLHQENTKIDFENIASEAFEVYLDESQRDHTPTFGKLGSSNFAKTGYLKERISHYLLAPSQGGDRLKNITEHLASKLNDFNVIADSEIRKYVARILEPFTDEQLEAIVKAENSYAQKIRQKINKLLDEFAEGAFEGFLKRNKVFMKPSYALPPNISLLETAKSIGKSLYESEAKMNAFEERVIIQVASEENVVFWTRNIEKKGFRINGFINHYPDFIILTKKGCIIVLETKGEHLDAAQKIKLGKAWENESGKNYRYFMVYENREVEDAYTLDEFLKLIREL